MRVKPLISRIAVLMALSGILLSCLSVASFAQNDEEYKIAGYDVTVNINQDGSADITENIDFTFYDGFNNIMIPIAKNEGEEIDVEHVYMLRKEGLIDCKRLLAGQWDAEVFTGTYSVIDESNDVKLKLYGSFYQSFGSVILQYKVKNAVKRYQDVAEYDRTHIPKSWETRISNINISINIPKYTDPGKLNYWLHGVLVGRTGLATKKIIVFNVPDTVPGEYVETRVLFPQNYVQDYPLTENKPYLDQIIREEADYAKSDKTDLLAARETAARNAALEAFSARLRQRAKNIFSVISLLLCALAVYYVFFVHRKIRQNKNIVIPPVFHDIEKLDPAEVRMLLSNGRTGARAILGEIFELAAKDYFTLSYRRGMDNKTRFAFKMLPGGNPDALNEADQFLLSWIRNLSGQNEEFDPIQLLGYTESEEKARELKHFFDGWGIRVREAYNVKDILDVGIVRYRNIGIIGGTLLLLLGFIIPITLSIAAGYAMIPAGLGLLTYALRIRKHTDYGVCQHRIWKTMRHRISRNTIALDTMPEWMRSQKSLIAYAAAMGVEKEVVRVLTDLVEKHPADCVCMMCSLLKRKDHSSDSELYRVIRNTLKIFDSAVSSVQDAGW